MEKLVQDLKKGFINLVESITSWKNDNGKEDGEEPKSESMEVEKGSVQVQERVIQLRAARGPTRPSVPRGPPAQTG
ncbi:hypothetical protein SLEP1_g34746 [Rubroshorea leprosula]|uniref:Uncharacterized protein n=1 Tax=Rubroshorea leprosula TaxID=152421 RepID=A0AAV5KKZ7_9ROSI|nr:hypothetical protein SLEP1_g34746 [Rubroshorea leprosula]